jgi:hypothetical protein
MSEQIDIIELVGLRKRLAPPDAELIARTRDLIALHGASTSAAPDSIPW